MELQISLFCVMNLYPKYFQVVLFSLTTSFCLTSTVFSQEIELGNTFNGSASYYSLRFSGRKTASGELLNNKDYTCAHPKFPFGTMIEVENPLNGKWVVVRVNDRGPFSKQRVLDLSFEAAKEIGMIQKGIIKIIAKVVGKNGEILLARNGATENSLQDIFSSGSSDLINSEKKN